MFSRNRIAVVVNLLIVVSMLLGTVSPVLAADDPPPVAEPAPEPVATPAPVTVPVPLPQAMWPEVMEHLRPQYTPSLAPAAEPQERILPAPALVEEQPPLPKADLEALKSGIREGTAVAEIGPDGQEAWFEDMPLALRSVGEVGAGVPVRAQVEVWDKTLAEELSPVGVVFHLDTETESLSAQEATSLQLVVDYSQIPLLYGGSFASRLALYAVSDCGWQDYVEEVSGEIEQYYDCEQWQVLPGENDPTAQRLVVDLQTPDLNPERLPDPDDGENRLFLPVVGNASEGGATASTVETDWQPEFYVLSAQSGGAQGDYAAQPLASVADFQVGIYSGSAQTSYPILAPPVKAGPSLGAVLSYDSGGIDGMVQNKNNQPGSVGLGWNMDMGSIQRVFRPCDSAQAPGDLCLNDSVYYLNLNGVRSKLVSVSNVWTLQNDPRWEIERLQHTNSNHPDSGNHFYWVVTTPDGTQYRFGGEFDEDNGDADLNSAWYVPTYSTAYCTSDAYRVCNKVWKWNLDRIEDPNGNVVTIAYEVEDNYYDARTFLRREYVRAGHPHLIEYGKRDGQSVQPVTRMRFNTEFRCTDPSTNTFAKIESHSLC